MSEERLYTLTLDQIEDMLDEADEGHQVSKAMLKHHLEHHSADNTCALLAELLWANFNIKKLLEEELLSGALSDDGNLIITEKILSVIQTLVFSKELAGQELNKLSISTKLN